MKILDIGFFLMLNTLERVYGLCINFFFATQLTMF